MTRIAGLLTLLALWAWIPDAWAAGSMRCDGRIVSEGMLEAEVLSACGEPAYRDPWTQRARNNVYVTDSEEWYYNFGSSKLLMVVKMRNGHIANIDSDGYGFDNPPRPPCNPLDIVTGLSKFRLVLNCGQPATQKAMSVLAPPQPTVYGRPYGNALVPVYREEWVYNFGSSYLLRIVTLENGRITDVQNGNRGFD